MSDSLREQLLKMGLATERQVRDAERAAQHRPSPGRAKRPDRQPTRDAERELAARRAQLNAAAEAKLLLDQAQQRRQQEKAERTAKRTAVKSLVQAHRIERTESEEYFSFVDAGRIKRLPVDATMRARIAQGEVGIVRSGGRYELVPAAIAESIRALDAHAVLVPAAPGMAGAREGEDADHPVPDDLMW